MLSFGGPGGGSPLFSMGGKSLFLLGVLHWVPMGGEGGGRHTVGGGIFISGFWEGSPHFPLGLGGIPSFFGGPAGGPFFFLWGGVGGSPLSFEASWGDDDDPLSPVGPEGVLTFFFLLWGAAAFQVWEGVLFPLGLLGGGPHFFL